MIQFKRRDERVSEKGLSPLQQAFEASRCRGFVLILTHGRLKTYPSNGIRTWEL